MNITLISSETCNKCRFIENPLQEYAEKNWYEFTHKDISEATAEETEWAMSLPIIIINNEKKDYDDVIVMLSNQ